MTSEIPNSAAATEDFEFSALHEAYFYPRAIVREFSPYLRGHLVEVGAGIGQMATYFAEAVGLENFTAIEPDPGFAKAFRDRCPALRLVEGTVSAISIDDACDTIVSVNVMEHIEDHVAELSRYHALLKSRNGHLCILTPARPEIYAPIDRDFGHFRRYTKRSILEAVTAAGFRARTVYYFNFPGYFVWLFNFKLLKSRSFNPRLVRLYDRIAFRMTHALESNVMRPPIGQSIICIAEAI